MAIRKTFKTIVLLFIVAQLTVMSSSCKKESKVAPNIDTQKLDEAFANTQQMSNLKSMVVIQNGSIIKEVFYGTGGADLRHDVRSVTKSITSLLIGIAIDKGFIASVDQPLSEFIDTTNYTISTGKAGIKIRHLLTMTSGFEWDEMTSNDAYNNWVSAENQVQYLFDKPLAHTPGTYFTYNTAALHLLSVIITNASGMNTKDFAMKYLFEPLGIKEIEWETDNQGFNNGGSGLEITPYDMVKIGQLMLNGGVFNGKTIVSQDYITQSMQSKISTQNTMMFSSDYGYCWWLGQNEKRNYAFANGYGGQFIVVVPNLNVIVVATNDWSGIGATTANSQWNQTMDIILNLIIPAFK